MTGREGGDAFGLAFEDYGGDVFGHVLCDGDDAAVADGAVGTEEHFTEKRVNNFLLAGIWKSHSLKKFGKSGTAQDM